MDKIDSMPEQMGSVSREMGILRKNLKEILDTKNTDFALYNDNGLYENGVFHIKGKLKNGKVSQDEKRLFHRKKAGYHGKNAAEST